VGALDQPQSLEALAQLAPEQRRLGGRLGVGLGGEEAQQPRHADDLAVLVDAAHADVVHPLAPVHGRGRVGLVDEQEVAVERAAADVGRQLVEGDAAGPRERRLRLVGEDPEPGAGDERDPLLREVVLARAEEHELAPLEPRQEVDDLLHLVGLVARGAGAGQLRHPRRALEHRREVAYHDADVGQDLPDPVLEVAQLLVGEPAVEVEVHDGLAVDRSARVPDRADAPVALARRGHDRMEHPRHVQAAGAELGRDGVHEERQVVRVGLQHGADGLVAVLVPGGIERADGHRVAVARAGELEQRDHLAEQRLGRDPLRAVAAEAAQVRARERPDRLCAVRGDLLVDQLQQPLLRPRARDWAREAHRPIMPLGRAECTPRSTRPGAPRAARAGRAPPAGARRRTAPDAP
jgi:hypothetical protein